MNARVTTSSQSPISARFDGNHTVGPAIRHRWLPDFSTIRARCGIRSTSAKTSNEISGVCALNCSAFREFDPSTSLIRTAHTSWIIFEWEGRARSEHETEEKKSGCDQIGYQLKLPDPIVSLAPYQFARDRLLSFAILLAAEER